MINLFSIDNIYIAPGPTDLRKSIDGCAAIVQYQMFLDPFSKSWEQQIIFNTIIDREL